METNLHDRDDEPLALSLLEKYKFTNRFFATGTLVKMPCRLNSF